MAVDEFGREIKSPSGERDDDNFYEDVFSRKDVGRRHRSPRHQESSRRGPPSDPSLTYVKDPLLCEYMWKEREEKDNGIKKEEEAEESKKNDEAQDDENREREGNNDSASIKEETPYEKYRRGYCLNYSRAFFNHHMDDTWFRSKYSPVVREHVAEVERERAIHEAKCILKDASVDSSGDSVHPFIAGAKLGGGQKQTLLVPNQPNRQATPKSHMFSWQQTGSEEAAFVVSEIPSHVTNEQIILAMQNHCSYDDSSQVNLTVYGGTHIPLSGKHVLERKVIVVGRKPVLENMWKTMSALSSPSKQHQHRNVPRKDDAEEDPVLSLLVDSTDPYGRTEYDDDGHGGAPPDNLPVGHKQSRVQVQRLSTRASNNSSRTPSTTVLSLTLSASTRHAGDQAAAEQIARALDSRRKIPDECSLRTVLEKLFTGDTKIEDKLDVCIAYLRRVHLIAFYNACEQSASSVTDVLTGDHAASTVHLRMQNADAIIETSTASASGPPDEATKDMLVERLEDSIEKAKLQATINLDANVEDGGLCIPVPVVKEASEIRTHEEKVEATWLEKHTKLDEDNRARCSFHFCRKLFKDTTFLHKHLLKKHGEFLVAEQAKCHDDAMMKAWDEAEDRPLPDILVECGNWFGFVAAPVQGKVPDCVDPEPDLWKRESARKEDRDRLNENMRSRREEMRQQNNSNRGSELPTSSFMDVDDMQEEKVEVKFDNVEIPVMKKKKKKRKLL